MFSTGGKQQDLLQIIQFINNTFHEFEVKCFLWHLLHLNSTKTCSKLKKVTHWKEYILKEFLLSTRTNVTYEWTTNNVLGYKTVTLWIVALWTVAHQTSTHLLSSEHQHLITMRLSYKFLFSSCPCQSVCVCVYVRACVRNIKVDICPSTHTHTHAHTHTCTDTHTVTHCDEVLSEALWWTCVHICTQKVDKQLVGNCPLSNCPVGNCLVGDCLHP